MIEALVLRLDAPLMSFGGVTVDEHGVTRDFPALSMLTGLLGNALGYRRRDAGLLERLQQRLRFAVRRDRTGEPLVDFQTVELGQDFLGLGWTTKGRLEERGGQSGKGTHRRFRHYRADAVYTLVATLEPSEESPTPVNVARALEEPARPLFLGRKPCLPSGPMLLGLEQGSSLLEILERVPRVADREDHGPLAAWWPDGEGEEDRGEVVPLTDERDWANQIHVGRRRIRAGILDWDEVERG